ncbi:MAG: hypothetical protein LBF51_08500 [Zoogloeaceae bacterium]|nr:hypothetical protein [Zoogloeaceae bacterium]
MSNPITFCKEWRDALPAGQEAGNPRVSGFGEKPENIFRPCQAHAIPRLPHGLSFANPGVGFSGQKMPTLAFPKTSVLRTTSIDATIWPRALTQADFLFSLTAARSPGIGMKPHCSGQRAEIQSRIGIVKQPGFRIRDGNPGRHDGEAAPPGFPPFDTFEQIHISYAEANTYFDEYRQKAATIWELDQPLARNRSVAENLS